MALDLSKFIDTTATPTDNSSSSVEPVTSTTPSESQSSLADTAKSKINSTLLNNKVNPQLSAAVGNFFGDATDNLINQAQGKLQQLTGSNIDLSGFLKNPLKIVERTAGELSSLTDGAFAPLQEQYRELADRTAFGDFVDNGYANPFKGDDTAASRIPNPLRNHNGFNYKITLGVLSAAEYNNPETYRSAGGFKNYVIQSSGGNLDNRFQVFDEQAGSTQDHAEYYIDDVNLDAVISPNPNTRVSLGTTLTFTVTEPYSMGNFIQAIIGSSADAGYKNYLDAPFCLRIDFVGWNEGGNTDANFLTRPIFIPIKLTNMDFNVTGQGSTYAITAVPMSESGLSDTINKIQTPIKATGTLLHEVLETADSSVSATINRQLQDLEEVGALAPFDRFVIVFPKTRTALVDAVNAAETDDTAFTTTAEENAQQQTGSIAPLEGATYAADTTLPNITIKPATQTYAILKTFAEDTNLMNEIGLSAINVDTNAPGNSSEASYSGAINPETGKVDPTAQTTQTADKARDYQFNQGEKITSIIEKLVVQTEYAAENATAGAKNGVNKWFKIDTQVFIDDSPITEQQMGRKPKVYVYSIMPYEVDEAVHAGPGQKPSNTQGLKDAAAKEYNYIYTGKNEDVLNFDINFNNAFMQTALANFGMNSGGQGDVDSGTTASAQKNVDVGAKPTVESDAKSNDDPDGSVEIDSRLKGEASGTHSKDIRKQIAEMFHDRITNMTTDMVTAEMEIFGDPFFIPQETGNYVAQQGNKPNTTNDGTMTYQQSQVFCVVNFKTPFDYQVKGATMEMPQVVPGFSGLFTIWAVTNRFSKGKFTQTLKMIRRKGQIDPATTGNTSFVQVDNEVAIAKETTESDGTVGKSAESGNEEPSDAEKLGSALGVISAQFSEVASGAADIRNLLPDPVASAVNSAADQGIAALSDIAKSKVKNLLG